MPPMLTVAIIVGVVVVAIAILLLVRGRGGAQLQGPQPGMQRELAPPRAKEGGREKAAAPPAPAELEARPPSERRPAPERAEPSAAVEAAAREEARVQPSAPPTAVP